MVNQFIKEIINYIDNKNHYYNNLNNTLRENIEKTLIDISTSDPILLREKTPSILVNNGVNDLPMYENPSHIRKNILTKECAEKLGLQIREKDNYHGLGVETYLNVINSLDSPRTVFKNKNNKDYIILSIIKTVDSKNIIVPIETETITNVNHKDIYTNRIKTVFGYDKTRPSLNEYIKYNIKNKKFEKIYEQKKQLNTSNTSQPIATNINISNYEYDVKHVFDELLLLLTVI